MNQQQFNTGTSPQINITECGGDLIVRSWADPTLLVKGKSYEVNEAEGAWTISSDGRLALMVPENATLTIQTVHGDLVMKHVQGGIYLHEIHGDAVFSSVGAVHLETVHSDISAKNLNGRFQANTIHGDAAIRNCQDVEITLQHGDLSVSNVDGSVHIHTITGDVSLRTVSGDMLVENGQRDVTLRNMGGELIVKRTEGDIRLYGGLSAADHHLTAGGDIIVRWPLDAPLNLEASGRKIANRLPLETTSEEEGVLVGRLGDGKTTLHLKADGRIILKEMALVSDEWAEDSLNDTTFEMAFDLAGLGERITSELNQHVAQITAELESKFGADFASRITERITKKAEQAAAKAERAAERARRRAERQARRTQPPAPPMPPKPVSPVKESAPKASPEEQLKILKMVENGTITPEEAKILLDALEG